MYYFERGPFSIPVFWRERGVPFFMNGHRISKRWLVWWMPTNWIAVPLLVLLSPITLYRHWRIAKGQGDGD